jgi:predicted short-subunit dehydrogenase-like oxidoreductase (DUF2520 family)
VDVSLVGAGTVATAFGVLLSRAGHRVTAAAGREATIRRLARWLPDVPVLAAAAAAAAGEVVVIGTPDDRIPDVCDQIATGHGFRRGQAVCHLSGAAGLDALDDAAEAGAGPFSLHPLQTFPDVEAALRRMPGTPMAVTARDAPQEALGERLVRDLGGIPFPLDDEAKPLYHAGAVFASNLVVAALAAAEDLLAAAGVAEPNARLLPLTRASIENAAELGPARALTGPAVRGDAGTVERNLRALEAAAPDLIAAYAALSRVALDLGDRAGRLGAEDRARVERVLARWS